MYDGQTSTRSSTAAQQTPRKIALCSGHRNRQFALARDFARARCIAAGEPRGAGQLVQRQDAFVALPGDEPGRITTHGGSLTPRRRGAAAVGIALDVREKRRRGPEPGLLLPACGSPVRTVEDGTRVGEMARERLLVCRGSGG